MFSGITQSIYRCSVAISHSGTMGLKRSGNAGMPFRTTSVLDDPTWRTTQFNSLLPLWMLIANGLHMRQSISQICASHSARYSGPPQTCSAVEYPMKFPRCNNGTAMQSHRHCWTGIVAAVIAFPLAIKEVPS